MTAAERLLVGAMGATVVAAWLAFALIAICA
jgi:hypothetical protein